MLNRGAESFTDISDPKRGSTRQVDVGHTEVFLPALSYPSLSAGRQRPSAKLDDTAQSTSVPPLRWHWRPRRRPRRSVRVIAIVERAGEPETRYKPRIDPGRRSLRAVRRLRLGEIDRLPASSRRLGAVVPEALPL